MIGRKYNVLKMIKENQNPPLTKAEIVNRLEEKENIIATDVIIQRDVKMFREKCGLNIEYSQNNKGYVYNGNNINSIDEVLEFLKVLNISELFEDSFKQDSETLKYIELERVSDNKLGVKLKTILEAIRTNSQLSFMHFSYTKQKLKKYKVKPYYLKQYQNRWYIIGDTDKGLRAFGTDRITVLSILDINYEIDPQILKDIKREMNNSCGITFDKPATEMIVLRFDASQYDYIKSMPIHSSQVMSKKSDGSFIVNLDIRDNYELKQQLLKYGNMVEVLEPKKLREEIKEILLEAVGLYRVGKLSEKDEY
ncbi:MAG: WYL domain-containing protein [Flavobacteriaceae bacterium]|nr:WYL domain-containing protein [Flavobacteriaceae bacterium]